MMEISLQLDFEGAHDNENGGGSGDGDCGGADVRGHVTEQKPRQTAQKSGYPDEDVVLYSGVCLFVVCLSWDGRRRVYRREHAGF